MSEETVVMQMGKSGLTDAFLEEIRGQLRKGRKVKVKVLRAAREDADRKQIASEVAEKTKAKLVDVRGNTFTLER